MRQVQHIEFGFHRHHEANRGGAWKKADFPRASSWPADSVETARIIRPLRVAEIIRAAAQGIRGRRNPDGIDQVRAGLHDHGDVRGPGNGETELVVLDAKGGFKT